MNYYSAIEVDHECDILVNYCLPPINGIFQIRNKCGPMKYNNRYIVKKCNPLKDPWHVWS